MVQTKRSRRQFLRAVTAAGAAAFAMPYVKTASSAGTLNVGAWDHWVPGANAVLRKICEDWGAANGIEVTVDFITVYIFSFLLIIKSKSCVNKRP